MKCAQALEAMLDAESADLTGDGSSPLAVHLRSCARCARVAAAMHADVSILASVMPVSPLGTPTPWLRWPGIALASAAAVFLFVVVRGRPVPPMHAPPAAAPRVVALPKDAGRAPTLMQRTGASRPVRKAASALYAMPDPVPVGAPAELQVSASAASDQTPAFDGVSASSAGRVIVLSTSNPKITVIWFN